MEKRRLNNMIKLDLFDVKALIALEATYWQTADTTFLEIINEKYFNNIDNIKLRSAYNFIGDIVKYSYMTEQKIDSKKIIEQLKQFNIEVVE